jgi:hypothetical protein
MWRAIEELWASVPAPVRKGLLALLAGSLSTAVLATWSPTALLAFAVVALGVAMTTTAVFHLGRALVRCWDPEYRRCPEMTALVREDLSLAAVWVAFGATLTGLACGGASVSLVAMLGAVAMSAIALRAFVLGVVAAEVDEDHDLPGSSKTVAATGRVRRSRSLVERAPDLPLTGSFGRVWGRKRPQGNISAYLSHTLLAGFSVAALYTGVAVASFVVPEQPPVSERSARSDPPPSAKAAEAAPGSHAPQTSASTTPAPPPPTYAQLCPDLPDPLAIGHGLGRLFRYDGAVEAGCGGLERLVRSDGSVHVAEGRCGARLRSLGVAADGHPAVLLYGAAARFAAAEAEAGELLYAEAASPADGELYVVATTRGTYVFVRMAPSASIDEDDARHCAEVDSVARPFAVLPPPLGALWRGHMTTTQGWLWPLPDPASGPGAVGFLDPETNGVVAHGSCTGDAACTFRGHGEEAMALEGPAVIWMADLAPWMPE